VESEGSECNAGGPFDKGDRPERLAWAARSVYKMLRSFLLPGLTAPMSNGPTLEIASLPTRHPPIGRALQHTYGPPLIVRLRIDPTPQPPAMMCREVEINWLRRPGREPEQSLRRQVGWSGLDAEVARVCEQLPYTKNAHELTSEAAVGMAALLIHDLEGGALQTVLQIGSGGDYLLKIQASSVPIQLEVSGILEDETGGASRSRLTEKAAQVLTHARVGFASVTTFSHGSSKVVHSYLHFTKDRKKTSGGRPNKPRRKRKKK
jgi:hypothetical protein